MPLPFKLADLCPMHDRPRGGMVGGCELYTCGCLVYEANLYHHCAMGGGCDPRWLKPDDWYAQELARTKDNAPA